MQRYLGILCASIAVICAIMLRADKYVLVYFNLNVSDKQNKENTDLHHILSPDKLSKFNGVDNNKICLAILGNVYDVSKGKKHYGPESGYHGFAGKDGSRAFATGDFTKTGLIPDTRGLSNTDILSIQDWKEVYDQQYAYLGKVSGWYYDQYGKPTEYLKEFEVSLRRAQADKTSDDNDRKLYPDCNSEWSQAEGGRVWCSNLSGGIQREWAGVPRQYFKPGKSSPRCACVKTTGTPSGQAESSSGHGDLDNPNFKLYQDCDPMSASCKIPS